MTSAGAMPAVSIVIPTHARPERLEACLAAVDRLAYPSERLEVIVVADGGVEPVARRLDLPNGLDVRVIRQSQTGPGGARNAGVAAAEGELVAFVDDDCEPDPRWLDRLVRRLDGNEHMLVGGKTVNALVGNPYAEASQALIAYLYDYFSTQRPDHMFFTTNNLAVRRTEFLQLGGFDGRFRRAAGEDREFCVRCARAGFRLVYDPTALMYHAHPLTLRSFWRQQAAYGREAFTFRSLQSRGRSLDLEPLGFYVRLVTHPKAIGLRSPLRTSTLLALSQLAHATGFAREAIALRRRGRSRGR